MAFKVFRLRCPIANAKPIPQSFIIFFRVRLKYQLHHGPSKKNNSEIGLVETKIDEIRRVSIGRNKGKTLRWISYEWNKESKKRKPTPRQYDGIWWMIDEIDLYVAVRGLEHAARN